MHSTHRSAVLPSKSLSRKAVKPVRRIPDWEASGLAGLLGGLTFVALEMAFSGLSGGGPLDAPKTIASIFFGGTLPVQSNGFLLALALGIHFSLSLVYARALALYLTFRRGGSAPLVGAAFGVLLYLVNAHGVALAVPRAGALQTWPWLLSHVGFGLAAATAYKKLERVSYE